MLKSHVGLPSKTEANWIKGQPPKMDSNRTRDHWAWHSPQKEVQPKKQSPSLLRTLEAIAIRLEAIFCHHSAPLPNEGRAPGIHLLLLLLLPSAQWFRLVRRGRWKHLMAAVGNRWRLAKTETGSIK